MHFKPVRAAARTLAGAAAHTGTKGGADPMTTLVSTASDRTALSAAAVKAEIIRIRQGFDRPPPSPAPHP